MKKIVFTSLLFIFSLGNFVFAQNEASSNAVNFKLDETNSLSLTRTSNEFTFDKEAHQEWLKSLLFRPFIFSVVFLLIITIVLIYLYKNNKLKNYKLKFIILGVFWIVLPMMMFSYNSMINLEISNETNQVYYLYNDENSSFWEAQKIVNTKCQDENDCKTISCNEPEDYEVYKICDQNICSCLYGPISY